MRPRAKRTEGVSPRTHSRKTLAATLTDDINNETFNFNIDNYADGLFKSDK